jgi:putative ABC transport system permease protein
VLSDAGQDLRYAWRALVRAKVSAAILVVSLGVGLGANAVLYRAIDTLLFRPASGVDRPSRLVRIVTSQFNGAANGPSSWPDTRALAAETPALARLAAFDASRVEVVRLGEAAERVRIVDTEATLFEVLGGAPELARLLRAAPSAQRPPAIISDALWTSLDRPADIIGRELRIGDRVHVVAGIGPAGFRGLELSQPCDVWVPLDATDRLSRGDRRLSIVARLADGADVDTAQQQATRIADRLAIAHPETNRGARGDTNAARRFSVLSYTRIDPGTGASIRLLGTAALGATLLLLVSACVNAAAAMASRSAMRRRELAVKVALGAGRGRLVRQTIAEGWFLAGLGASLGLLLAYYTSRLLPAWLTPEDAALLVLTVDSRLVAAMIAFALVAGALFAIGPARHVVTTRDIDALRAGSGQLSLNTGGSRLRRIVVSGQVALSTVILLGAGVLVRGLSTALDGEGAAAGRQLAIASVDLPPDAGAAGGGIRDPTGVARDAVLKLPGVSNAGWVTTLPLRQAGSERFEIDAPQGLVETIEAEVNVASADYFATLGMTLVAGRTFDNGDRPRSSPVVVVNDALAQRDFGGAAIGQYLREANGRRLRIVGIVRSVRYRALEPSPEPTVYFPPLQRVAGQMHLIVQTAGPAAPLIEPLRACLLATDPRTRVGWIRTFDDHLAQALTIDRVLTTVVAVCGLLALALSTAGVYGVSADAVQRRTGEIGLRVALGAGPRAVVALVGREALTLTASGVGLGAGAALTIAGLTRTIVHGLPWPEPQMLALVAIALLLVALGAAGPPSWRALRISPTIALRTE